MTLSGEIGRKLSPGSRLNGEFDAWILNVASNPYRSVGISKTLLVSGHDICHDVDEGAYRALIDTVTRTTGMGKGVFLSTMKYMSETFARTQLKMWSLQGALETTTADLWQSSLTHALTNDRPKLGLDIIGQMLKRSEKHSMLQVFASLDDEVLVKIPVLWKPYAEDLVSVHCSNQSFSRAREYAVTPRAKDVVLKNIAASIGYRGTPDNWASVMRHMIKRSKFDGDSEELVTKHRSAAVVVIGEILAMDDEAITNQLNTDELRLMAFKLGLESAVESIQSLQVRAKAFMHSLAI
ncbi:hypothetical protein [Pseudomonas sp. PLMAX]|uniref:hypothetical protein n=1 Tax=Pseudomonas sp. PLMAX TaxID=2201998 RepID=UPI0038B7456E